MIQENYLNICRAYDALCRFFLVFILIVGLFANLMDVLAFFDDDMESSDYGFIIGTAFISLLFVFPLIYHAHQGFIELRNHEGFSNKRRFRTAGIVFNVIFTLAGTVMAFTNLVDTLSMGLTVNAVARILPSIIFLVIIITVLITDNRYSRASRT